jgi:hypothetical protein
VPEDSPRQRARSITKDHHKTAKVSFDNKAVLATNQPVHVTGSQLMHQVYYRKLRPAQNQRKSTLQHVNIAGNLLNKS